MGPAPQVFAMQVGSMAPVMLTRQSCPEPQVLTPPNPMQVTVPQAPVVTLHVPLVHVAIVRPEAGQSS
jgi:hypothetical protein